jgi:folylpolyglutamate synthase/dihydropteroate synthase
MSNGPINTNPNAVGEVGGAVAGLVKKAVNLVTGGKDKSSREEHFTDSASLHKTVLAVQKAEHSHAKKEAALDRTHELSLHEIAAKHAEGYTPSSSKTIQTKNLKLSVGGNKTVEKSSEKSFSTKKPVPTAPLSRRRLRRGK